MASSRWSVRARRQWRQFNTEPPVVRVTAAGAALVLLIGLLAAVGHSSDHKGPQSVAARGRTSSSSGIGVGGSAPGASVASGGTSAAVGGANSGGAGVGALPGAAGGTQAGTGVAPDGSPLTASDRGVTATKIKVIFPYADLGAIGSATGLDPGNEDEPTSIMAYVNDINSRGGINGRLIDPEIVKYNPLDDAEMRADCKDWTQSQEVFAVVDSAAWHDDHQLCITQENHTPLISKWTTVRDWTDRGNPYLWWTGPDSNEVLDNLVVTWKETLLTKKFAVLSSDRESDKLALSSVERSLANIGAHEAIPPQELSFTTAADAAQAQTAYLNMKTAGVEVVLPVVSFLQILVWLQEEDSQNYFPQLLLSDYESNIQVLLGLAESKYAKELQDTKGPSAFRLGSAENPSGYTALGQTCFDKYLAQDPGYPHNLEGVGVAMTWCQNIYLFERAATMAGNNLTRDSFNTAMSQIQGFAGSISPDLTFGPDLRSGPHQYRMVQIHVNDRANNSCPDLQQDGNPQGSCWLLPEGPDFHQAQLT
jgi:ABC-type branched-subunit amino acid transport system substrate-binding protein